MLNAMARLPRKDRAQVKKGQVDGSHLGQDANNVVTTIGQFATFMQINGEGSLLKKGSYKVFFFC